MKLSLSIGKSLLEFDGKDFKETAKTAAALTQASNCGLCKSENVALGFKVVKGKEGTDKAGQSFDYYSVKCVDCGAEAVFGMYQSGGMFLKQWAKWDGKPSTGTKKEDF